MFAEVIGQISWQDVKKLVITTLWPLSDANVNFLPWASNSERFKTLLGIGWFKYDPPPRAAIPWPTAGFEFIGADFTVPHPVKINAISEAPASKFKVLRI